MDRQNFIEMYYRHEYHAAICHLYFTNLTGINIGFGEFANKFNMWLTMEGGSYAAAMYYFMDQFNLGLILINGQPKLFCVVSGMIV